MKHRIYATLAILLMGGTATFAQAPAAPPATAPGAPAPTPRPRVPARGPSIDLAYEAAKAAVASCTGKPIGVAIVDKTGQAKLIYIPDGSVTDNAAMAVRKADTALLIGAPSNQLYARATADKTLAATVLGNTKYIIWGGGLPILVNGEVIGAIGVSGGGPEGIDDGCAQAGLAAIQDKLK
jgi:uncharacterized protein GlcG (DUF336 family)